QIPRPLGRLEPTQVEPDQTIDAVTEVRIHTEIQEPDAVRFAKFHVLAIKCRDRDANRFQFIPEGARRLAPCLSMPAGLGLQRDRLRGSVAITSPGQTVAITEIV